MKLFGINSRMSTSHHPQTDGTSEVINRMLENYLTFYCTLQQVDCATHLPAAEFAYNSSVSEEMRMTPFEVDLGWNPKNQLDLLRKDDSRLETAN